MDPEKEIRCPECGGTDFVEDHKSGDCICSCGIIVDSRIIDPGQEWRDFSDSDKDASRIGKVNPYVKDLSTTIAPTFVDGQKSKMPKWQSRMLSNSDRNIINAFERLEHLAGLLNLNESIKSKAKEIYKEFEDKRTKSTRYKKDPIIVSVLAMACKEENVPRSFKELARETQLFEKDIRKEYKNLTDLLGRAATRTSAPDLVSRFCSKLNLEFKIEHDAIEVATKAGEFVEGKSPSSIAAASILIVSKLSNSRRHEKDIAEAATISATTIRNVYKELLPFQSKILPEHLVGRLEN